MLRHILAAWIGALVMASPAAAGPLEDAAAASERGDYAKMLMLLRPLAEKGNAVAQIRLATMYEDG